MLKCIIVGEQPKAVQWLVALIKKIPFLEFAGSFSNPKPALLFLRTSPVDLIFLEIKKSPPPGDNSISLFQQYAMVILMASNRKFALDGFDQNAIDFLLRPVSFERFSRSATKAYKLKFPAERPKSILSTDSTKGGYIFIKEATRLLRVELDDIYYVTGLKNYVSIQTKTQRIVSLQTMKQIEELLPSNRFIRVHRSYFIAMDKIISIEKQQVHVKDKIIPIGQIYLSLFMKKLPGIGNQ